MNGSEQHSVERETKQLVTQLKAGPCDSDPGPDGRRCRARLPRVHQARDLSPKGANSERPGEPPPSYSYAEHASVRPLQPADGNSAVPEIASAAGLGSCQPLPSRVGSAVYGRSTDFWIVCDCRQNTVSSASWSVDRLQQTGQQLVIVERIPRHFPQYINAFYERNVANQTLS